MNAGEASEYPSRVRRRNRQERFRRALSPKKFTTSNLNRAWRQAHRDDRPRAMQWICDPRGIWCPLGPQFPEGLPVDIDYWAMS